MQLVLGVVMGIIILATGMNRLNQSKKLDKQARQSPINYVLIAVGALLTLSMAVKAVKEFREG